jgi:hypothetical protein
MRALGATIAGAVVATFAAASVAYAQGQISDIRFGKQPDADRIVLDLSVGSVDATQTTTADEFVLELSATRPNLSLEKENKLEDLKINLQDSSVGTRIVVERRNRPVQVFRIVAAPGSGKGDRLVMDVGKAGGRLTFPTDAARVPEGNAPPPQVAATRPVEPPPVSAVEPPAPPRPEPRQPAPAPAPQPREEARADRGREQNLLDGMGSTQTEAPRPRDPAPTPRPAPSEPAPADPKLPADEGEEKGEDVWVLVRSIDIQGVTGSAPSLEDLNELKLAVSPVRGGFVAPRDNRPVQRLPLRALVGDDRNGRRLSGSVLQLIVETIAAEYTRNEKLGTRVDIRRSDLEGLMQGGDGRLVIRVKETPARAAGSVEP